MLQTDQNAIEDTFVLHEALRAIPRLIVLDLEATGLNFEFDRIIELGVIEFQQGKHVLEYSRQFRGGLTFGSTRIHGIGDKERQEEEQFEECAQDVSNYLSNASLAGHNIHKFDHPMIVAKLRTAGCGLVGIRLIDTMHLAKRLGVMGKSLKSLCSRYDIPYGGHRGLDDARSTLVLLNVMASKLGVQSPEELYSKK